METIKLENIKISDYIKMLKIGTEKQKLKLINEELTKRLSSFSGSSDVSFFLLQKDLLLLQCRYYISFYDFDEAKQKIYLKKIEDLREEIGGKIKNVDEVKSPYEVFLDWILSIEKNLGFSIDYDNDLMFLVTATLKMLKYNEEQLKRLETKR